MGRMAKTTAVNREGVGRAVVVRVIEVLVAAVFIYAGVLKIYDPVGFARDIDNYKLAPWTLAVGAALYLPWLEVFCGLTIVLRRLYPAGLFLVTALLGLFIGAGVIDKIRGIDVRCGCFGHAARNLSFAGHLLLDLVLLAGVLLLWFFWLRRTNTSSAP